MRGGRIRRENEKGKVRELYVLQAFLNLLMLRDGIDYIVVALCEVRNVMPSRARGESCLVVRCLMMGRLSLALFNFTS